VTIKQFFQVQGKQREEGHPTELDPQDPVSKKKKKKTGWGLVRKREGLGIQLSSRELA
jgi:hypothetical protein